MHTYTTVIRRTLSHLRTFSLVICLLAGCANQPPAPDGKPAAPAQEPLFKPLFGPPQTPRERWTIRCVHSEAPNHAQDLAQLAQMLRNVEGLHAAKVRLVTNEKGSTIYYGEYLKITSPQSNRLVFPPEYQHDIQLIRSLAAGNRTPFFYAEPELLEKAQPLPRGGPWEISNAKGAYSLLIAAFYNTGTFTQRVDAANEYTRLLRDAGYSAYLLHDENKSLVFVGDFEPGDIVVQEGTVRLGPRVEQFIARNEKEFRYISENGQIIKRPMPNGQISAPLSYLVPVPRAVQPQGK